MADDEVVEPQAGELTTANYGWVKPNVGASDDVWGGYINGDLDGIDTTVKGVSNVANAAYPASNPAGYQTAAQVTATLAPYALTVNVPIASASLPIMDGTAAAGSSTAFARGDHVHPTDTSRAAVSAIPAASSTTPAMDGTAAVGTGATWARADHVHPSDTSRLAISGGTMTGPIVLAADPVAAMQPATKQYVDGGRLGDNRIINGDMRIDQRNNGAGGTAIGVYTVDRWKYNAAVASKGNWQRNASICPGFPYHLAFLSSSAYTAAAGDFFMWLQPIEADMISDFQWGTANAQPVTLSFWVVASQAGTYSGSIRNATPDRSYVFTFAATAAWTKVIVTIPGDTAGTWALSGNGVGLYLAFDLGSGSTWRTATTNAWTAGGAGGGYVGANGAVSVVGTNAANINFTGVKLEIGSVATPFNRQSLAKGLADCQRYYQLANNIVMSGYAAASTTLYFGVPLPTQMRAAPTINYGSPNYTNASGLTVNGYTNPGELVSQFIVTATGLGLCVVSASISAEL